MQRKVKNKKKHSHSPYRLSGCHCADDVLACLPLLLPAACLPFGRDAGVKIINLNFLF